MTCQECQPLAIDLARGLPPFDVGGAVERADVLAHIATCKRCAQWFRQQEALSDALRAAAAADASLAAPSGVEAHVMAAWRARQAQRQMPLAHPPQLERPQPQPQTLGTPAIDSARTRRVTTTRAWAWAWRPEFPAGRAAAFAAAAAIVIAALTLRWLNPVTPPAPPAGPHAGAPNAAGASTPASLVAERSGRGASESTGPPVAATGAAVEEVLPDKRTKGRPAPPRVMAPHAATAAPATARRLDAAHDARGTNVTRAANATRRRNTARAPSVTRGASEFSGPAFVLLPYVEPLRPTEMRHIMRVRMSRTQLAASGLQAGSVDDAVLADVLVGEDGTARAVRIVQ